MRKTRTPVSWGDHIDPERGHLVCGFNVPSNWDDSLTEKENRAKQNSFVPYLLTGNSKPHSKPHDMGVFLINEEWVECPYLGELWWSEAIKTVARRFGGQLGGQGETLSKDQRKQVSTLGGKANSKEHLSKIGVKGGSRKTPNKKGCPEIWFCLLTGKISRPGSLTMYQKSRGLCPTHARQLLCKLL